jgi:hypothetical protein
LVIRFLLLAWTKTCDDVCTLRHVDKSARFRGPLGTVYTAHRLSKTLERWNWRATASLAAFRELQKRRGLRAVPTDDQDEFFDEVGVEGKPTTRTAVRTVGEWTKTAVTSIVSTPHTEKQKGLGSYHQGGSFRLPSLTPLLFITSYCHQTSQSP